ncbi:MAG: ribose 5-phosphate isomerase B [Verrucomicrobiota bacterium]
MKISIGSDHAGFPYKTEIIKMLKEEGHEVLDFGTESKEKCDYPDFVCPAAAAVAKGEAERGIVLGGSGNGEAIAANKIKGVRCALCWDEYTAEYGRKHNDCNCISIGKRTIPLELALKIVRIYLATEFEGGRHVPRIEKTMAWEQRDPATY